MQDTLLALVDDFKVFIMTGIQTLPMSIAGTLIVLGFGTANYPMLFFLVGMLLIAPLVPFLINFAADDTWKVPGCGIAPGQDSYILSQWVVMVYFFLGYMMTNAITLYQMPATDPADPQKTALRQSQCVMGIIALLICMVAFGVIRLWGCNLATNRGLTIGLTILAAIIGAGMGVGWYYLLDTSASGRLADLFGIANRLLSPSAFVNEPVGCVAIA
jgi:hypothetical protein